MTEKQFSAGRSARALSLAALVLAVGSAAPASPPVAGGLGQEFVLRYKMPAGQVLRYRETAEMKETSDRMGQVVETVLTSAGTHAFRAKGNKGSDHLLEVTIEDMTMAISSAGIDFSPDLGPVHGKTFEMVLSSLGTEVDVSGAESITYMIAGNPRDVSTGFRTFFPDLPDRPVQEGGTWPSSYAFETKSGTVDVRFDVKCVNTREGSETIDGLACVRIRTTQTGSISGKGSAQGADLTIAGTLKGTDIWHFAPGEGLFVRMTSEFEVEAVTTLVGAQSLEIPSTQKRKGQVSLVAR